MDTRLLKSSMFLSTAHRIPYHLRMRMLLAKFHLNLGPPSNASLIAATSTTRRSLLRLLRRKSLMLPLPHGSSLLQRGHHRPTVALPPVASDAVSPNGLPPRHPNASALHVLALFLVITMTAPPRTQLRLIRPTINPLHRIFARPRPRSSRGLDGHNYVSSHQDTIQGTEPDRKSGTFCNNWFN